MKFVLASQNKGKLLEMQTILSDLDVEICTLDQLGIRVDVEEDGKTFEENSLKKALAVMHKTGLPAIADDSGLCVEELGGAPGIYSARYGGDTAPTDTQRNALVLQALRDQSNRSAKFVCVVTCCFPIGMALATRGECEGSIVFMPTGVDGFGYDSIFQPLGEKRTFAEMSSREKNAMSHRGNALRCFRKGLGEFLQTYYQ
ncbi:MAG: RdgB/HAM1 family non-canonical purine NTP pyrophosphatase [Eubacteriales bacterium]